MPATYAKREREKRASAALSQTKHHAAILFRERMTTEHPKFRNQGGGGEKRAGSVRGGGRLLRSQETSIRIIGEKTLAMKKEGEASVMVHGGRETGKEKRSL